MSTRSSSGFESEDYDRSAREACDNLRLFWMWNILFSGEEIAAFQFWLFSTKASNMIMNALCLKCINVFHNTYIEKKANLNELYTIMKK